MFFTYISRELRRRKRQAFIVALGLALGIGLVVTMSAMASGVRQAQSTALQSLYGVGTDVTVTQPAARGSGPGARFGLNPGDNQQGQQFSRDQIFTSPGLGTMDEADVATVAGVSGVHAASGALSLTSVHVEGQFADFGGFGQNQGQGPGTAPTAQPSVPPIEVTTYTITGIDVANTAVGPVSPSQITAGRFFTTTETDAKVAVIDASYAKQKKLTVGSTITISRTDYDVIGITTSASGAETSNVYIPLARAQKLGDAEGKVSRIYVKATSASAIDSVQAGIEEALPKATVTAASDLATEVTGSLSSASTLSQNMGKWLAVAGLIAAFAVASLLTFGAVGRRTREFGTLRPWGGGVAGWSAR